MYHGYNMKCVCVLYQVSVRDIQDPNPKNLLCLINAQWKSGSEKSKLIGTGKVSVKSNKTVISNTILNN